MANSALETVKRWLRWFVKSTDGGSSLSVAARHESVGDLPSQRHSKHAHSNPLSTIYPVHPNCMTGCDLGTPECEGYCRKPRTSEDKW